MHAQIAAYNEAQSPENGAICDRLAREIAQGLPDAEGKVWHGGPVWFLDGNPIAGYWVRTRGVQLLFWSGQSFDEPGLTPEGKFKAAEAHYTDAAEIDRDLVQRWLAEARVVQWDYKNIVKRRGVLERLDIPMRAGAD
ncbi:MAG: DUF1801 domain-containing protein [Sphingomonadales bacterium]|nr:MAG: DUF1801 domain-containing protein [Sphingomonadales bacterium]